MELSKFKNLKLKANELCSVKGGTSTTLMIEVGVRAENEYEDTNGDGKFDKDDKFIKTINY
ncbi:hypothetical protein ED312_11205 [Sinomicrobium pectinilyticum]|uniref:Uncharacterized protein n=1 Tax=Sinomicrobium pectinilyticum TaxID=1084421 RepID=A0A3N0EFR8_SINP1|nr:hypothetical protein [Sinomicrobium pectinilyticum]RNL86692.1 hypothetical protein ED312_11205 [Sinomicrobium pectinilyticum]